MSYEMYTGILVTAFFSYYVNTLVKKFSWASKQEVQVTGSCTQCQVTSVSGI